MGKLAGEVLIKQNIEVVSEELLSWINNQQKCACM